MAQIEKLTPEQEERIPVVRDKWLDIGLATGPCNRRAAKKWAKQAYEEAGQTPPKHFFWFDSPLAGAIAAMRAERDDTLKAIRETTVEDFESLTDEEKAAVGNQLSNCCYGNQDADWLSFYDYFLPYLEEIVSPLVPLINHAQHCGWWWAFDGCCIMTERPVYINMDDQGRLHHENRKALEYADGFGLNIYHGVRVPADYIEEPEKITKERIMSETNQEFKRIMLDIYGMAKFLESEDVEVLHEDNFGKLIAYKGFSPEEEKPDKFVIVKDPSTGRVYALGCDPDAVTAKGGVASTFGMTEEEYNPVEET